MTGLEIAVIGLGSNLLVADEGYDGVVIRLAGELARIERDGERVACGGGASLAAIVKRATGWGLSGIEFGCAIPGTAGGAVRMNAGAYGGEIRDVLADALVIGVGRRRRGGPDELGMSYRRSTIGAGEVVAEAVLELRPGDPARIRQTVAEMQRRRREAQPAKVRTFGSVWKNPDGEPHGRAPARGVRPQGVRRRRRPNLARARELHREPRRRAVGRRDRAHA